MKNLIIFGSGQIAETLADAINYEQSHNIIAFVVEDEYLKSDTFKSKPLFSINKLDEINKKQDFKIIIAVGYQGNNYKRKRIYEMFKNKGYLFDNFISKDARLTNVSLGENNIIFENNNIQSNVCIENNNIFWSGNHIGHHTKIGSNCFISSHVVISGSVKISDNCFFGVNSTIRDNIYIGKECIIGAGSIILKNLKDKSVIKAPSSVLSKVLSDKLNKI